MANNLKAFRLNEHDWYAAESFIRAIMVAEKETGNTLDDILDLMFCTGKPEREDLEVFIEEGSDIKKTVRELLDEMDSEGFAFGIDW